MLTIFTQVIGLFLFLLGTLSVGIRIRRTPDLYTAMKASRTSQVLFWMGLVLPGLAGFQYPGLTQYDQILGIPSLPVQPLFIALGIPLLLVGLYLLLFSNRALSRLGEGAAAFWLTGRMVTQELYQYTRNPMSLGYYLMLIGIAFLSGSSSILLGSLLIIPAHIFNLLFFEERELEIRMGSEYKMYRDRVPFLIPSFRTRKSLV